jgi:hypothetical protein
MEKVMRKITLLSVLWAILVVALYASCGEDKPCPQPNVPESKLWPKEEAAEYLIYCAAEEKYTEGQCTCQVRHLMLAFSDERWQGEVIPPAEIWAATDPCDDCD